MAVPRVYELYAPVIRAIIDGEIHCIDKIIIDVAEELDLSAASLAELLPSKRNTVFDHRVGEALKDLVKKGYFVEMVSPDHFRLTEEGKRLVSDPAAVDSNNIRIEIAMKQMATASQKLEELLG